MSTVRVAGRSLRVRAGDQAGGTPMLHTFWRLLADWACPGRAWRDLGNVGRSRLGDHFLRRTWQ